MQDKAVNKLLEYLTLNTAFARVEFVKRREYGPSDFPGSAYIRMEGDRDGRDYYTDGDYIVGRYVLVGESVDERPTLQNVAHLINRFPNAMASWQEASENSEVIYQNETDQSLTADCEYMMIRFEMRTENNCTLIC